MPSPASRPQAAGLRLPLAPFEQYMLLDDRPSHPMTFPLRLRFRGAIERSRFDAAFLRAAARHPLLSAVVRRRRGQWHWEATGPTTPDWQGGAAGRDARIDLTRCPGLRCRVTAEAAAAVVTLHFHHSCCDGAGAAAFVSDLLVGYARGGDPADDDLPPLEPAALLRRGRLAGSWRELLRAAPRQLKGLQGVLQYALRKPAAVAGTSAPPATLELPRDYPAAVVRVLDRERTEQLRGAARRLDVSLNELMLRDIFLSLHHWRTASGVGGPRDWLRLSVPISLRTAEDALLPAANRVSMVFLDRRRSQADSPPQLLESIRREMRLIRRCRLELTFLLSLRLLRRIPGAMRRAVSPRKCAASGIVSNLGEPLRRCRLPRRDGKIEVAGATLESIEVGAPNRPFQAVAFLLYFYAERLHIVLQHDSRAVGPQQAGEIMSLLQQRLQRSIDGDDLRRPRT